MAYSKRGIIGKSVEIIFDENFVENNNSEIVKCHQKYLITFVPDLHEENFVLKTKCECEYIREDSLVIKEKGSIEKGFYKGVVLKMLDLLSNANSCSDKNIVKVKLFDENDYHFVNQTHELLSLIHFVTNSYSRAVFSYKAFEGMHDDYSQELYEKYRVYGKNEYFNMTENAINNKDYLLYEKLKYVYDTWHLFEVEFFDNDEFFDVEKYELENYDANEEKNVNFGDLKITDCHSKMLIIADYEYYGFGSVENTIIADETKCTIYGRNMLEQEIEEDDITISFEFNEELKEKYKNACSQINKIISNLKKPISSTSRDNLVKIAIIDNTIETLFLDKKYFDLFRKIYHFNYEYSFDDIYSLVSMFIPTVLQLRVINNLNKKQDSISQEIDDLDVDDLPF